MGENFAQHGDVMAQSVKFVLLAFQKEKNPLLQKKLS